MPLQLELGTWRASRWSLGYWDPSQTGAAYNVLPWIWKFDIICCHLFFGPIFLSQHWECLICINQVRNFLMTLFLSQGVPVLNMGDEYGATKEGMFDVDSRYLFIAIPSNFLDNSIPPVGVWVGYCSERFYLGVYILLLLKWVNMLSDSCLELNGLETPLLKIYKLINWPQTKIFIIFKLLSGMLQHMFPMGSSGVWIWEANHSSDCFSC